MSSKKSIEKIEVDPFSVEDAKKVGVSPRMLHYLYSRGEIFRVSRGYYSKHPERPIEFYSIVKEVVNQIKAPCVVCLQTALQFHDLTDENSLQIEVLVPRERAPKKEFSDTKIHLVRGPIEMLDTVQIEGITVTSIEQTLVDLMRFHFPMSKIHDAYHVAVSKGSSIKLDILVKLAAKHRVVGKMKQFIEVVL